MEPDTRNLQNENPIYESVYQHLVFLYVLNGSRLDLLRRIDRRLRGLAGRRRRPRATARGGGGGGDSRRLL